jgi:hypothetical protein
VQRLILVAAGAIATAAAAARPSQAQMLGTPVLQNAFLNPGFTIAANFGTGSDANAYGGAVAWAPRAGRVQLSGGAALFDPDVGSSRVTWGVRAMAPIPKISRPAVGVAAFAGIGGLSANGATTLRVPLGVSVGYRRALRRARGISGYVAPFYSWSHLKAAGATNSAGLFRVSFGVDVAILPILGATVGYETGGKASAGEPGPTGGLFGIGLSYALRRPR